MPTGHINDKVRAREQMCVPRSTGMGIKKGLAMRSNIFPENIVKSKSEAESVLSNVEDFSLSVLIKRVLIKRPNLTGICYCFCRRSLLFRKVPRPNLVIHQSNRTLEVNSSRQSR